MSKYSKEFKREAVRQMSNRGDLRVKEVATALGVASGQLYQWRKEISASGQSVSGPRDESKEEELFRLRREVLQLRKERDILKKSTLLLLREQNL